MLRRNVSVPRGSARTGRGALPVDFGRQQRASWRRLKTSRRVISTLRADPRRTGRLGIDGFALGRYVSRRRAWEPDVVADTQGRVVRPTTDREVARCASVST